MLLVIPLPVVDPKLCALLYPGGICRCSNDSSSAERNSHPDRSPYTGSLGMICVVYRKRNQIRKADEAADPEVSRRKRRSFEFDNVTMAATRAITQPHADSAIPSKLRDYYTLTKPEVNLLILMTTSAGYYLGARGTFGWLGLVNTLVGTLLVASGTATLNQCMERAHDARMRRTANRPLVSGRLPHRRSLAVWALLSVAGGTLLAWSSQWLSASRWPSGTLLAYLLVYTPLKRKTSSLHAARSDSGGDAYPRRMGRAAGHD